MAADESRRLVEQVFAAVNARDWGRVGQLFSPDYVNHSFPDARGAEGFRQVTAPFFTAFPDLHVEVAEIIAEGDKAASRGTMSGTHQGEFMGIAATGKPVRVGFADSWRFENGKAVENWVQMDMLGMMQQVGAIPAQG